MTGTEKTQADIAILQNLLADAIDLLRDVSARLRYVVQEQMASAGADEPVASVAGTDDAVRDAIFREALARQRWTEARDEYLKLNYPMNIPRDELLRVLNLLPGHEINQNNLGNRIYKFGLLRDKSLAMPIQAQKMPPKVAAPEVRPENIPRPPLLPPELSDRLLADDFSHMQNAKMAWKDVLRWGEHNKIDVLNGDDDEVLERINATRATFLLPPFVVDDRMRAYGDLPHPSVGAPRHDDYSAQPKSRAAGSNHNGVG